VVAFPATLEEGDGETAHGLLCAEVRAEVDAGEVPAEYRLPGPGEVVRSMETEADGAPIVEVVVRWADDTTSRFSVVNEDGPHVCGMSSAG
jgi:hypothetical protein